MERLWQQNFNVPNWTHAKERKLRQFSASVFCRHCMRETAYTKFPHYYKKRDIFVHWRKDGQGYVLCHAGPIIEPLFYLELGLQ